jgi:inner membrane protein
MASAFTHAVVGLSIGSCFYHRGVSKSVWVGGMICAALPDMDAIGFRFGVPYCSFWGHRGFTHSVVFAALLGLAATLLLWHGRCGLSKIALFTYLFLATASHGVLDAMTNGGFGVAFFSPFENNRYFLPFRPIRVSPISVTRFFTPRGLAILRTELVWVWVPAIVFAIVVLSLRRLSKQPTSLST